MEWFFVALLAPFLWSLVNHIDKLILSRYFHGGGSGGLMIFIGVTALPIAIVIALLNPAVLSLSGNDALLLIASGIFYNVAVYLYMVALEKEDTSYVVPFWQLVPVFAYFFGIVFLGEFLSADKLIGGAIVIFGALVLSIQFKKNGKLLSFNKRTVGIMVLSSIILALGYLLFKDADGGTEGFWVSMFWNQVGMCIFSIMFFLVPLFRREFLDVIKQNSASVLSLNLGEQILEVLGIIANNFAILLAPAALIILVEYTAQPLFVFLFGIILTVLFPTLIKEDLSKKALAQKCIAIIIMAAGLFLVV